MTGPCINVDTLGTKPWLCDRCNPEGSLAKFAFITANGPLLFCNHHAEAYQVIALTNGYAVKEL